MEADFDDPIVVAAFNLVVWVVLRDSKTLLAEVIERRVVRASLVDGFTGLFLDARACILVFFEVFVVRFVPYVFAALDSSLPLADTLFEGGCGGWVEARRFVMTRGSVDSESICWSRRRTGALPRVERGSIVIEASEGAASASKSNRTCGRLLWWLVGCAGEGGGSGRLESRVLLWERVRGPEPAATSSNASRH
jgi:hypothetical protein